MLHDYLGVVILGGLSALLATAFIVLASTLGPKRPTPEKGLPFECGTDPISLPHGRLSIKFYLLAMLFILFDIELVFLFPWAVLFRELGTPGFLAMLTFLGLLGIGLAYAWRKGALEWSS